MKVPKLSKTTTDNSKQGDVFRILIHRIINIQQLVCHQPHLWIQYDLATSLRPVAKREKWYCLPSERFISTQVG